MSRELLMIFGERGKSDAFGGSLEKLGYRIDAVDGEAQAAEALAARGHGMLLVDAELAKADGYALVGRLRSAGPTQALPIVVFCEAARIDGIEKAIESGADEYIALPADQAVVKARLATAVQRRSAQEGLRKLSEDFTKVILPIGIALSAEKDLDLLIERIIVEAKSICNADGGTLYLRTDDDTLKFEIMHTDSLRIRMGGSSGISIPFPPLRMRDRETDSPNHHNVATHVALDGVSINIPDIYNAVGFDFSGTKAFDAKNHYCSTSSLTVPLKNHDTKVIGVLQLINSKDEATGAVRPFSAYAQQIVELLSSQAAMALSNQIMQQREKLLVKFENDVQIGRKIQTDFLPEKLPQPPGCEVVSCFRPAREVSGDFYDAFMLPGSLHMGFVLADVCDKGVPAALFMAVIRSLIRSFCEQHVSFGTGRPDEAGGPGENSVAHKLASLYSDLSALNAVVMTNSYIARTHSNLNMFATMFFGVLDPVTGLLTYINGGQEAPAIIGSDGVVKTRLDQTGPAVGMMPDSEFDLRQHQLDSGDTLYAFTDGVPDTRDADAAFFSEKRLFELLQEEPVESAKALVARIETALRTHIGTAEQFDDITMLAVRWSGPPASLIPIADPVIARSSSSA
jgi:sigma-B regulation protein RsbU (phosphoserine phosphatase)